MSKNTKSKEIEEFEKFFRKFWEHSKKRGLTKKDIEEAIREVRIRKIENN